MRGEIMGTHLVGRGRVVDFGEVVLRGTRDVGDLHGGVGRDVTA